MITYFRQLQKIVDDKSVASKGEKHLGALTAGDRIPWAKARDSYFKSGKNKFSLSYIEKVVLKVSIF